MFDSYKPQDAMALWWLGGSSSAKANPRLIGKIFLADNNRKVALEYDTTWLASGFALSGDLPLARGVFLPKEKDSAVGAIDDARPDRWGERVIRNLYKPPRLSLLEYLYFAGDDRFGALGVSLSSTDYQPNGEGAIPTLDNLRQMHQAIEAVLAGERVNESMLRLIKPGPSFGGARPKSMLQIEGAQWIVKFPEGEDFDTELVEHATMLLASKCGIHVAETRPLTLPGKSHAIAVRRFDRVGQKREHVLSASTVLRAAGLPFGYPELAQVMRRLAQADTIRANQLQLFRRMVFNILIDNTDDHEKNHALIRTADGYYHLAPAYDVVPSVQGLGQQQLRIGKGQNQSTLENALSESAAFGLKKDAAAATIREIATVVNGWKEHLQATGVGDQDIQRLAQYIDGDALRGQRTAGMR